MIHLPRADMWLLERMVDKDDTDEDNEDDTDDDDEDHADEVDEDDIDEDNDEDDEVGWIEKWRASKREKVMPGLNISCSKIASMWQSKNFSVRVKL